MTEPLKPPSRSILTNHLQLYPLGPIFIVLITNVITRLLPYDNAIYLVFVAKKEAFLHTRLKAFSGDPLIYVDFTTCFQSWTPCFLFGVRFISRKLENCTVKAINVDEEKNT